MYMMRDSCQMNIESIHMKSKIKLALLMLVTAAIPTVFLLARIISKGTYLSPDSLAYLYAGANFFEYGSFLREDGSLLTLFPPLYPAAIAVAGLFTNSLENAASLVNVACMFSGAVIVFAILHRLGVNNLYSMLGTFAVFLSYDMQFIFTHVWSEVLYVPVTLIILLLCCRNTKYPVSTGAMLGIFVGCAFLTRYVGISLLLVALVGLACMPMHPVRQRLKGMASVIIVSTIIIGLWIVRNYYADGTFVGPRAAAPIYTLTDALEQTSVAIGRYIIPGDFPIKLAASIIIILIFISFLAIAARWTRQAVAAITPAITLIVVHAGVMIYSGVTAKVDPLHLHGRLLIPLLAPIVIITVIALKNSRLSNENSSVRKILAVVGLFIYFSLEVMVLLSPLFIRWIDPLYP
jgi:hypothetical protein